MADLRSHERGELAYNAYRETTGGKTWNNYPMPMWADLPAAVQNAWNNAAFAVRRDALNEVITMMEREVAS